jgi:hypothetical protein
VNEATLRDRVDYVFFLFLFYSVVAAKPQRIEYVASSPLSHVAGLALFAFSFFEKEREDNVTEDDALLKKKGENTIKMRSTCRAKEET